MAGAPDQQLEAMRETLRLVGDLSDALMTQLKRVQRLSGSFPSPPPPGLASELIDDAARIKQHCEQLRQAVEHRAARAAPEAETATEAEAPRRAPAVGDAVLRDDAVKSLALEMRMQGSSYEEVERYLASTFGREDATHIANEVFHRDE